MPLIQAFKLGAVGQNSLSGTRVICMYYDGTVANRYSTFETPVGTDYQVPAGYTFYITKLIVNGSGTSVGLVGVGYGDDGVAAGSESAPTNWTQLTERMYNGAAGTEEYDVLIPIPTGKYPCAKTIGSYPAVTAFGVEIAN